MNIFIAHIESETATLTSEESWHCAKVLRKKSGELVHLIDGNGKSYEGLLELVTDKKCVARITKGPVIQTQRNYYLHLAIAPTKQIDRMEWMLEKAVEIGIDEISFILCKNSERTAIKTDRLKKIVESAVKQSLQATIPKINPPEEFKKFIRSHSADQKLIAHCFDADKHPVKSVAFANKSNLVLIGPEGDFSLEEIQAAHEEKYQNLSLGENRLRTETAGLYVCQAASLLT